MTVDSESVLEQALALAVTPTPAAKPAYIASKTRKITRRGILWLGQTCNLRCHFCYFLDRIEDERHPEHAFMSLDKAKEICRTLVEHYGNNSIDIQGGEPTLYPQIYDLVAYCAEIGLSPTIITNAQVLANRAAVTRFRHSGLRDFLVSVQGLGAIYDELVGRQGAHVRQMKALCHLQEEGIPFRFNTVVSKPALEQLAAIARLAVRTGAEVVNFLGFNPFNDQQTGKRSAKNVPRYAEVSGPLDEALDLLAAAGVEANVRYLPFCVVAERHRPSVYDFPQIPYDLHENDFASWSWTDLPAQRMRDAPLTPPFGLGPRLPLGALRTPLRRLVAQIPRVGDGLHEDRRLGGLAGRPDDLLVTLVADEQDRVAVRGVASRLHVHLRHERARGVDRAQAPCLRVPVHGRGDPVGRQDHGLALGHLALVLDEDRAPRLEVADDVRVVHDLLADVDRPAVEIEQLLDRVHGPLHACAVPARRSQENALDHRGQCTQAASANHRARFDSPPVEARGDPLPQLKKKKARRSGGRCGGPSIAHRGHLWPGTHQNRGSHRPVPVTLTGLATLSYGPVGLSLQAV